MHETVEETTAEDQRRQQQREYMRRWREEHREERREAGRRWREEHREQLREAGRRYREANREQVQERNHRWHQDNLDRAREAKRRWQERIHAAVFDHYGRACACCGATDRLSIDHVNGDGREHRQAVFGDQRAGPSMYAWLIRQGFPPGFQTLCRSCNRSKGTGPACRLDHAKAA